MAYFKSNESEETRRTAMLSGEQETEADTPIREVYDDYDDGLDDPAEEEPEEDLTEEEEAEIRKGRIRLLFGAGNLTGIIIGSVLILLLLLLLFFMIDFVWSDLSDRFKLYGTKF